VEQQLSEEETQKLWNEEAAKLEAGDNTPAFEAQGTVPVDPPQEDPQPQAAAPDQGQEADPLAGLPEPVKQALARITELETANSQLLHHVKTAEGRVAAMQREFQQVMQQRLAPVESVAAQSQEAMYWQTVQAAHPDFQEAAAALPAWIQKQPAILRPTLERVYNGGTAVEVVELLSAYKQAIGSTGAAPVTPASSAAQVTPRVAAVDKAVLAATLAPPAAQRSTKQTSRDPNDVEGSFMEAFG